MLTLAADFGHSAKFYGIRNQIDYCITLDAAVDTLRTLLNEAAFSTFDGWGFADDDDVPIVSFLIQCHMIKQKPVAVGLFGE